MAENGGAPESEVPSPLPGLGAAIAGGLGCLTPYRPYFIAFALIALAWTFLNHFGGRLSAATGGARAKLAALLPSGEKDVLLYLGAVLVFGLMIVPPWSVTQFFQRANPRALFSNPRAREAPAGAGAPLKPVAAKNPCSAKNPCAALNPCSGK